jgi:hypothetical protein
VPSDVYSASGVSWKNKTELYLAAIRFYKENWYLLNNPRGY